MSKRIIAYLKGGLGNQCFIYAAARAHALRTGAELILRQDYFPEDSVYHRSFDLGSFAIQGKVLAPRGTLMRKLVLARHALYSKVMNSPGRFGYFCDCRPIQYRPMPSFCHGTLVLDGYWHSHEYYDEYAKEILKDFALKDSCWLEQDELYRQIGETGKSVFCHLRSYQEVPGHADFSWALPISYYERALAIIRGKVGADATIFVFSDNLDWAVSRLKPIAGQLALKLVPVERREGVDNQLRDFMLLRRCRHGIAANSSYSRFASWLGETQCKVESGDGGVRIRSNRVVPGYCPENWINVVDAEEMQYVAS